MIKQYQYKIVRFYRLKETERVLRTHVSQEHAKEHCLNPESSWKTCMKPANRLRTDKVGPWYDTFFKMC